MTAEAIDKWLGAMHGPYRTRQDIDRFWDDIGTQQQMSDAYFRAFEPTPRYIAGEMARCAQRRGFLATVLDVGHCKYVLIRIIYREQPHH